jgi:small subunit ribosomal protein S3
MGQKTHPVGFRLGVIKPWKSRWYAERDFGKLLKEDETIRKYLHRRLAHASVADVEIDRKPQKIVVTIQTARPGVVIGKQGSEVDKLRDELAHLTKSEVSINVEEIKRPELNAQLVGDNIAHQLSQRVSFRRALKRAVQSAMRAGAEGIKVQAGGRLGGAEIARSEGYHEGRVPLHTLRADIDYATSTAKTTYGTIGVKVWIFKGEVVEDRRGRTYSTGG